MIVHVALPSLQLSFISNVTYKAIHVKLHVTDAYKDGT